jgi:carboxyl-terminal processing protease
MHATLLALLLLTGITHPVVARGEASPAVLTAAFLEEMVEELYGDVPEEFATDVPGVPLSIREEVGLLYALGFSKRERVRWNGSLQRGLAVRIAIVLGKLPLPDAPLRSAYRDVRRASDRQIVAAAESYQFLKPLTRKIFGLRRVLQEEELQQMRSAILSLAPPLALPPLPSLPSKSRQREQRGREQRRPLGKTEEEGSAPAIQFIPSSLQSVPHGELLQAIWQLIEDRYLRASEMDRSEMGYKAIEAFVGALGDSYSTFYRPKEATDFQHELQGEISGIGAQVEERDGKILVVTPLPGSPAERAGVLPGDEIVAVDGESVEGVSLRDTVMKIRGKEGTAVKLELRRNGSPLRVSIVRAKIEIPEIVAEFLGSTLRVRLIQFGNTTLERLEGVLEDGIARNPSGLILDLRNNPGGLLSAAVDVVSHFLPQGSVVAEIKTRDGATTERTTLPPVVPPELPVVVLVNRGSASASEIVAAALQEYGRATIVGEKTFGKGTVQEVIQLLERSSTSGEEDTRESALKVTVADWLTKDGKQIERVGVTPDIEIVNQPGGRDDQLDRALQILRQRR